MMHTAFRIFTIVIWLLSPLVSAAERKMTVTVADDLGSVSVAVSPGMSSLVPGSDRVRDSLTIRSNGRWHVGNLIAINPDLPIEYEVSLRHSTTQWGIARWHRRLRLSDWTHWLMAPRGWSMTSPFRLDITVPDGGSTVLPFQLLDLSPGRSRFKAYPVMAGHGGLSVFGNVEIRQIKLSDKYLTTAVVGHDAEVNERLFQWMHEVATAAARVHGAAPGGDAHIIAIPVPYVRGMVPWAHVRRGGGSHVIAYVNDDASADELLEDWTLFHELTHLYHPYLRGSGRWVSEGFASYYQNLYRAEAGVVTPEYAYSRLRAGLERGRKENARNGYRPVTSGGRMRTYWTGAAMALAADAELRSQTNGEVSLALLMGEFAVQNLPARTSWYPRDYLAALDKVAGTEVLVPLYDSYVRDRYFPNPDISTQQVRTIFKVNHDSGSKL